VARVVYTANAVMNLERIAAHLREVPDVAAVAVERIRTAIELLEHHPFVGRVVDEPIRELVISFGRTGYLALYRFVPQIDQVWILALRHQRELDYP